MHHLTPTAEKIFRHCIAALNGTDHTRIDNTGGTFMPLIVERIGNLRFLSAEFPLFSFAHYGEQNGDAMRDPDVVMMDTPSGLVPISYRNDYLSTDQEVLEYDAAGNATGRYVRRCQADITTFCNGWARNIRDQQRLAVA